MYFMEINYNDGTDETKQFKSFYAACQYAQHRRGVESCLIEKCVDASSPDLEEEFESILGAGHPSGAVLPM
jgi:hypothetical protein